jgi:ElaB/YqjD/DUF883 family membrane-anchored ribosome-binding protein
MQQPPSQGVGGTGDSFASQTRNSSQSQQSQGSSSGSAANELKADAQQLGSKAANRLHSEVDARKDTAATQAKSVSSALEQTAGQLDESAPEWLKSAFRQGAQQIQSFADSLEQKDSRQLMRDVESFARERPAMFLGACAAAGFAAARVFRAGGETPSGQGRSWTPRAPSVEPPYGSSGNDGVSSQSTQGELA